MTACQLRGMPAGHQARELEFWQRLEGYEHAYAELWWSSSEAAPILGDLLPRRRQRLTSRACRRLIDGLAGEAEQIPDDKSERASWRRSLQERVQCFGEQHFGWPEGYRNLLFADDFFDATVEFVRLARAFDETMEVEEVGQALRNVWIANSLQMLLDLEVRLTPSVFAYSMLYPLTDNYLDDPAVPREAKQELNQRLERRLAGGMVEPLDGRQRDIFKLVEMVEEEFERARYPEVFCSLQAIHRGQIRSLTQQQRDQPLAPRLVLDLSVGKGGASVLADGYVVAGDLSPNEADFCFGYGVFLQLLDDLQDARGDRAVGHHTLFSLAASRENFDRLTASLYHFMLGVVSSSPRFAAPRYADLKDLILRNCTTLLVGAVAENPDLFSRCFRRKLECCWPLEFSAMRRLKRRAEKRYRQTSDRLRSRRRIDSILDLLTV